MIFFGQMRKSDVGNTTKKKRMSKEEINEQLVSSLLDSKNVQTNLNEWPIKSRDTRIPWQSSESLKKLFHKEKNICLWLAYFFTLSDDCCSISYFSTLSVISFRFVVSTFSLSSNEFMN